MSVVSSGAESQATQHGLIGEVRAALALAKSKAAPARWLHLSPREIQLILGVLDDLKESAIARLLRISTATVHDYFKDLYPKLGVHDRHSLVSHVLGEYFDWLQTTHQIEWLAPRGRGRRAIRSHSVIPPQEGDCPVEKSVYRLDIASPVSRRPAKRGGKKAKRKPPRGKRGKKRG